MTRRPFRALLALAASAAPAAASGPVPRTATGCVREGVFVTDDGYPYRVMRSAGRPMSLRAYEGMRIRMSGNLLPGDVFYPSGPPQNLGRCPR